MSRHVPWECSGGDYKETWPQPGHRWDKRGCTTQVRTRKQHPCSVVTADIAEYFYLLIIVTVGLMLFLNSSFVSKNVSSLYCFVIVFVVYS